MKKWQFYIICGAFGLFVGQTLATNRVQRQQAAVDKYCSAVLFMNASMREIIRGKDYTLAKGLAEYMRNFERKTSFRDWAIVCPGDGK